MAIFYQNCISLAKQRYVICLNNANNKYSQTVAKLNSDYNANVQKINNDYNLDVKACNEIFSVCVIDAIEKYSNTSSFQVISSDIQTEIEDIEIVVRKTCSKDRNSCLQDAITKQRLALQRAVNTLQDGITKASNDLEKDQKTCQIQSVEQQRMCDLINGNGFVNPIITYPKTRPKFDGGATKDNFDVEYDSYRVTPDGTVFD